MNYPSHGLTTREHINTKLMHFFEKSTEAQRRQHKITFVFCILCFIYIFFYFVKIYSKNNCSYILWRFVATHVLNQSISPSKVFGRGDKSFVVLARCRPNFIKFTFYTRRSRILYTFNNIYMKKLLNSISYKGQCNCFCNYFNGINKRRVEPENETE
jgi:hypothetical protein